MHKQDNINLRQELSQLKKECYLLIQEFNMPNFKNYIKTNYRF